jgi:hypothetical protein
MTTHDAEMILRQDGEVVVTAAQLAAQLAGFGDLPVVVCLAGPDPGDASPLALVELMAYAPDTPYVGSVYDEGEPDPDVVTAVALLPKGAVDQSFTRTFDISEPGRYVLRAEAMLGTYETVTLTKTTMTGAELGAPGAGEATCPGHVGRGVGAECVVCGRPVPAGLRRTVDSPSEVRADCVDCGAGRAHGHGQGGAS